MRPMVRLRKPMLYPLSYEGITGFSSHAVVSSTTSAQHFRNNYSLRPITPHYSSTWTLHDEFRILLI